MGLFDKHSIVSDSLRHAASKTAAMIENAFNTKVYDYGIARRGTPDFEYLLLNTQPFADTKYIWYFLVPVDDADNIITNDYYEKTKKLDTATFNTFDSFIYAREFQNILKKDWDLSNYIQTLWKAYVYDYGSLKVSKYSGKENIVPNAEQIDDLRYRFFRFFMTSE